MEKTPVHHLHVKYAGIVYTVFHTSEFCTMQDLYRMIKEIKEDAHETLCA